MFPKKRVDGELVFLFDDIITAMAPWLSDEYKRIKSFTLTELLIVIGIIAVMAAAVVIVLDPIEYLGQARDATRASDMDSINTAVGLFASSVRGNKGTTNKVYISIPNATSDCIGVSNLPVLPVGWSYSCSTPENYKKTDGTGWIPINFDAIPGGSTLPQLPIDPQNDVTIGKYYSYMGDSNGYEVVSLFESERQLKAKAAADGGYDSIRYERGSNISYWRTASRMAAYWPIDEASGTVVNDVSASLANGNFNGSPTRRNGSECVRGGCIEVTGANYINVPYKAALNIQTNVTYSHWVKIKTAIPASYWPYSIGSDSHKYYSFRSPANGTNWFFEYGTDNPTCGGSAFTSTGSIPIGLGTWRHLAMTYNGSTIITYIDGRVINTRDFAAGFCSNPSSNYSLGSSSSTGVFLIDEAQIYSRVLSPDEIVALYKSGRS